MAPARTQHRSVVGAVLVALAVLTAPLEPAVAAGDPSAEATARAHFRRGEADYAAGKYAVALEEYQAGYDAAPLPGFLVNIAQCQRRLGDLPRARATYSRFIMMAPDSPLVPEVTKLVAELDRLLAQAQAAENAPRAAADPDDVVEPGGATSPGAVASSPPIDAAPPNVTPSVSLGAPEPAASQAPHVDQAAGGASDGAASSGRRWWLWGGAAVVVAAGAVTAAILLGGRDPQTIHDGSLGTLRR